MRVIRIDFDGDLHQHHDNHDRNAYPAQNLKPLEREKSLVPDIVMQSVFMEFCAFSCHTILCLYLIFFCTNVSMSERVHRCRS